MTIYNIEQNTNINTCMHPTSEFCKQMKESLKGRYELTIVDDLEKNFVMGLSSMWLSWLLGPLLGDLWYTKTRKELETPSLMNLPLGDP